MVPPLLLLSLFKKKNENKPKLLEIKERERESEGRLHSVHVVI